jgi:hypothetical protein
VRLPVNAGEAKIRRGCTDGERGRSGFIGSPEAGEKGEGN